MQDALSILLESRVRETSELQEKARDILENLVEDETKTAPREARFEVVLVPAEKPSGLKAFRMIDSANKSIDILLSWKSVCGALSYGYEMDKKALKRGVKYRIITERPTTEKATPKHVQELEKNPNVEIRYVPPPLTTGLLIFDNREAQFATTSTGFIVDEPTLWTDYPGLVEIAHNYFEQMWKTSKLDK